MNLKSLNDREEIGLFLNKNNLLGQGVEVGSLAGDFARSIVRHWHGRELFLVDPWEKQDPNVYKEPVNDCDWNSAYESCKALADDQRFGTPKVTLVRGYSPDAARWFTDGSLSFCYIDANHSLECARADIKAWWPKVVRGGLFGGHDFRSDTAWPQNCQVKEAVEEFAGLIGVEPHISRAPGCYSWWFEKV